MENRILKLIAFICIIVGLGVMLYPSVSNYFAEKNHVEAIRNYDTMVVELDTDSINEKWNMATEYNENLAGDPVHDPFVFGSGSALPDNYKEVLNISEDGVMAYIDIPEISTYLPIYHGTSEETLEKGVGHIESTSLPIGSKSSHCVLTGHTGLPSAELFTRIDELKIGDIFYIHVLDEILTYRVYETKVILPNEIDELQIEKNRDLVTLVTCTPYGVNTHRLLVKAERTEYVDYEEYYAIEKNDSENESSSTIVTNGENNYYLKGILIGIVILVFAILFISSMLHIYRRRKRKF